MARVLREADVARVIEMDAVIAAVTAATRDLAEGKAQNEPRRRAFAPRGFLNVMFAAYPGGDCLGLKAYSVADGAVRFLVTVFGLDGALTRGDGLSGADAEGAVFGAGLLRCGLCVSAGCFQPWHCALGPSGVKALGPLRGGLRPAWDTGRRPALGGGCRKQKK